MEHLAFASAVSLAHKIQRKDISARELLEFYLQRVEHYNPRLNAIIFRQDEQARQRADAADAALARGEVWGPLHGVPMTIKESFDWVGSPSTRGNPAYQHHWQGYGLPGVYAPADMATSGPLARSADDLAVALEVLAGAEGLDAQGWQLALPAPPKRALKDYKVAVMLTSPCCAQDDELTAQLQQAVDGLAQAGVQVDDTARPALDLQRAHHLFLLLLRAATGTGVSDQQFAGHLASAAQRVAEDRSYSAYLDRGVTLSHRAWWQLHNEREQMRLAWADFFRDYDLFLCPTAASAAFPHDHEGERSERTILVNGRREPSTDQLFWAGLSGMVYLSATVAPVGLMRSHLPCGLQMVGAFLHDRTCIDFARLVAQELGGFIPPPGYH